jgi:hypothetical protein
LTLVYRPKATSTGRTGIIVSGVVLFVVVGAVALAQTSLGTRVLHREGLAASSEAYTALAFTEPDQLGNLAQYGQFGNRREPVVFSVANQEHHAVLYGWRISVDGGLRIAGVISLRAGQTGTIKRDVFISCVRTLRSKPRGRARTVRVRTIQIRKQARVVVTLAHPARSIDFLVACHA